MLEEFSRTELLLGKNSMKTLRNSTVLVFGVGGVGSHCIEALARCGVGKLILVDHDKVSVSNINRQSIAYHSTVGQYKTRVMKERIGDICSETKVVTHETFVLQSQVEALLTEDLNYIVDAIDTVTAKLAIAEVAWKRELPLISSMGTGNKLHPELFEITDLALTKVCPLCKVMRRELKARGIYHLPVLYSAETPVKVSLTPAEEIESRRSVPGSIAFVPPAAGLMIAGEVIRQLILQQKEEENGSI